MIQEKERLNLAMKTKFPLYCREDGTFRVLCVSDFHAYHDRPVWDPRLKAALEAMIKKHQPDLVFIAGDLTHDEDGLGSDERLRAYIADIMEYCEKNGIPWAHIPGNHDRERGLPPEVFEEFPHCLSRRGPEEVSGYGTYVLPVWRHDREDEGPAFCIWAFDSHTNVGEYRALCGLEEPVFLPYLPTSFDTGYQSVFFNQCAWYWEVSEEMERTYGHRTPGIMVMHTALPEHGLIPSNPTQTEMKGEFNEFVGCAAINTGLFAAAYERREIREIVCGHDHINTFSGQYMGITLSMDGGLGFDAYGDNALRGGRLITFGKDNGSGVTSEYVYLKDCPEFQTGVFDDA